MSKRLCSLLLVLALLLCAAAGLAEQTSTLTAAQISALQKLVGDAGTPLGESAQPTRDMTAFQAWQWTDRLLAGQVRSLLGILDGTMPVYIRFVDTGKMVLAPRTLWALDHPLLYSELNRILGEENVVVR